MSEIITSMQDDMRTWLSAKLRFTLPEDTYCIGRLRGEQLVGVIGFCHHINKSILIHSAGVDGYWVTRDLLRATFQYPFKSLNCNVLIGQVGSNNEDALRFNEHLGFKISCIIEDAHTEGDLVIMTMYRHECRYLDKPLKEQICVTV